MTDDGTFVLDDVSVLRETAAALRISYAGEEMWIPKSVVHDDSAVYAPGHSGEMIVELWWAEKLKLVEG